MGDQRADIAWRGTVPVSARFDDPYYSLEDGVAETAHVFLRGNGLPERFRDGFRIAELGFGTGLNLLVALDAFRRAGIPGRLHFTSFEAYPLSPGDMRRAQAAFPALRAVADDLAPFWDAGITRVTLPDLDFTLVAGDARNTLPDWEGYADAWFLDGFSPAKNPEMWGADLLAAVGRRTAPGGTCATYSAAGHIRRSLADAGFEVRREPGYGRKRHMTSGRRKP